MLRGGGDVRGRDVIGRRKGRGGVRGAEVNIEGGV